jgi:hypothetical protein
MFVDPEEGGDRERPVGGLAADVGALGPSRGGAAGAGGRSVLQAPSSDAARITAAGARMAAIVAP